MDRYETRKVELKTLSPICIKGMEIEKYAYNFVRKDEYTAYAIDSDKLGLYLYEKTKNLSLIDILISNMEKKIKDETKNDFSIEKFLSDNKMYDYKNNKISEKELIAKGVFKSVVNTPLGGSFIRNGFGKPFIPGSSIKGVLRTAVMYKFAKNYKQQGHNNPVKKFIEEISDKLKEFKKLSQKKERENGKKEFSKEIQNYIFQDEEMNLSPHCDFFRYINVKDTPEVSGVKKQKAVVVYLEKSSILQVNPRENEVDLTNKVGRIVPFGGAGFKVECMGNQYSFANKADKEYREKKANHEGKNILIKKMGSNKISEFDFIDKEADTTIIGGNQQNEKFKARYKTDKSNNPLSMDIETFTGVTNFYISIDKKSLSEVKNIPFSNINELFDVVNEFSKDLWSYEKKMFEATTNEDLNLTSTREFYKQVQPNKFRIGWGTGFLGMTINLLFDDEQQVALRNILFNKEGYGFPAPKTRRLIYSSNEPTLPLGWVNFTLLNEK